MHADHNCIKSQVLTAHNIFGGYPKCLHKDTEQPNSSARRHKPKQGHGYD